tara:strand:- start:197 stop:1252 length:1056 start_codon:yes stop_codon:yes gene_type:complete
MKSAIQNTGLMILVLGICLTLLEPLSRIILPVSNAVDTRSLSGEPLEDIYESALRFKPGLAFRQVGNEFDVQVTISEDGHRVPTHSGNPEVIFLGDSFTFGHGLNDDETFPFIYCSKVAVTCANLGMSGTGTGWQLDILEDHLTSKNWKPRTVKLFMFAMSGALMSGNDLADNLHYVASGGSSSVESNDSTIESDQSQRVLSIAERMILVRNAVLENSNLGRVMYHMLGPWIRTRFSPRPSEDRLNAALAATRVQIQRFEELARQYAFGAEIYLIHPIQDIMRGTAEDTMSRISEIAPMLDVFDTAHLFGTEPQKFYYSFDGHLNSLGSLQIAGYLINQHDLFDAKRLENR